MKLGDKMNRCCLGIFAVCAGVVVAGYVDPNGIVKPEDIKIGMVDPDQVKLTDWPIHPEWIIEGSPRATAGLIGHTQDMTSQFLVWNATAGRFNWFYDFDETVTIVDGEVFLTNGANAAPGNPNERRIGPGQVIFFHTGSAVTWRVPEHVRKIATIKHPLPTPVVSFVRWYKSVRNWVSPRTEAHTAL